MKIVISMWNAIEAGGVEMYLNNSSRGYEVLCIKHPADAANECFQMKDPCDVLMVDVIPNTWANLEERLRFLRILREYHVKTKIIVAIDENSFPKEAEQLRGELGKGVVDALFYDQESDDLFNIIDSLFLSVTT